MALNTVALISSAIVSLYVPIFALKNLEFLALQNEAVYTGVGAWLAINEINGRSDLLPNYRLRYTSFDTERNVQHTLRQTLDIIEFKSTEDNVISPIILGPPWSSLAVTSAPVLNTYDMGLMSESASSITLSDSNEYPYFYRTIPSDVLQAKGLIALCKYFNWTNIAIVYNTGAYGAGLSLEIQDLASQNGINTASIAVTWRDQSSYTFAAEQIKDLGVYIIILAVSSSKFSPFEEFNAAGIVGYPYYYLGVDSWMKSSLINDEWKVTNWTQGVIGSIPWQSNSLDLDKYGEEKQNIAQKSRTKANKLHELFDHHYHNGTMKDVFGADITIDEKYSSTVAYAYDALYTLAYAYQEMIDTFGENVTESIMMNRTELLNTLNDIIMETNFSGATGQVIIDRNGDRAGGFYGLCNILHDGSLKYFGYFYEDEHGILKLEMDESEIIFPDDFTEREIIPSSSEYITNEIVTIDPGAVTAMYTLFVISLILAILFVIIWASCRENDIIKAASWRLNIVMCVGAVMGYISGILFGIDEASATTAELSILCNVRLWMMDIAFTVIFMPLFLKTYRISQVFNTLLTKKKIKDKKLFAGLLICIVVDLLILSIFTAIEPLQRVYINGKEDMIDKLRYTQYQYGECSIVDKYDSKIFYGFLLVWKIFEIGFGAHVTIDVVKIDDVTNMLSQFDETGIQIISIMVTFCVLIIFTPLSIFGPTQEPNFFYLLISITIVLVVNIVIFLNLTPRTLGVLRGSDEDKKEFERSATKRFESALKLKFSRRFKGGWSVSKSNCTNGGETPVEDYPHSEIPLQTKLSIATNDSFNAGMSLSDITMDQDNGENVNFVKDQENKP